MIVFRLAKAIYGAELSGKGAENTGGRWNSKGVAIVYTSGSRALCTAELAVHLPLGLIPTGYQLTTFEIPDKFIGDPSPVIQLPGNWNSFPYIRETQLIGDSFIKSNKELILKVPSAVVEGDFNFLINPFHPGVSKIKILSSEPFRFDERLFRR